MRGPVNRVLARAVGCAGRAALIAAFAGAPGDSSAEALAAESRWIPSFALTSGVTFGEQRASVSSDCRVPGSDPPAPTSCDPAEPEFDSQLRPGDRGRDLAVTPYVGGMFQLATPALPVLGRPRLFGGVELPYHFSIDRNVAQKQRPTGVREPEGPNISEALDEGALIGVGSRTRSEVQGLVFGANAGLSFAFEAWGREFRVKPSANWIRFEIEVLGAVEAGICNNARPREPTRDTCDLDGKNQGVVVGFTRAISLKSGDTQWFDGVGPGLELEMDTGRFGPFRVSLFLAGGGYYLLGDRGLAFSSTTTIGRDPLDPLGETPVEYHADHTFRLDPWLYRAGLGMRFSWLGARD